MIKMLALNRNKLWHKRAKKRDKGQNHKYVFTWLQSFVMLNMFWVNVYIEKDLVITSTYVLLLCDNAECI